jgi:3-oxoacyl-[acyl-carrier protein] reductase
MTFFAREGASIIACVRKESVEFSSYIQDVSSKYGISADVLYFDMLDEESIKSTIKPLLIKKRKIDILVNNAGIAAGAFLQMTSMAQLKEVFQINFFSQVLITQLISKLMMREKQGAIINMGSVAGLENYAGYTAYGSSKAAIMYFTKTISKELAAYNIRVNAIAPGLTDTGMAGQMEAGAAKEMVEGSSMGRLAKPEEIAELALFLASDKSSFMTGQIVRIDGGM